MKKLKNAALILWLSLVCILLSLGLVSKYESLLVKNSGYRVEATFLSDVPACSRRKTTFQYAEIKYNDKIYITEVGCKSYKKGEKHYFIYSEKYDALASETHDYWLQIKSGIIVCVLFIIAAFVLYDRS